MSDELKLSPEQEAEAGRIAAIMGPKAIEEVQRIARIMASKSDRNLLGATEFLIRDIVHQLGAKAIETALEERKKGGT